MSEDMVGPDARVMASDQLADALRAVAGAGGEAVRMESGGVTRADVDALAMAGVLSAGLVPGWSAANVREVHEQLAAASGALWFVVTQHRSPSLVAADTGNDELRARWAGALVSGQALGAVAFAHLRRPGPPTVTAVRDGAGWRFDGQLDWVTSWGLADVLLLMGESPNGEVVQALLPASERPGLSVTGWLRLAAMQGTSTVGATLEGLWVADAETARVVSKSDWLAQDAERTANVPPAVCGLARAAVNALAAAAAERGDAHARELADSWAGALTAARTRAYGLVDDAPPAEALPERRALRARVTRLALESTSALMALRGGRAMLLTSPEQRWAREVLFALVQAQTADTREALLTAFSPA